MLRIPRDHAYQDHAPAYRRLLGKPQRLERNLNDHQIAIAVELGSGMPDRIEVIVGALVLRPESILLDAIRVRIEHVRMALVMDFFSSRRRHTRSLCDWSSDVCSSD